MRISDQSLKPLCSRCRTKKHTPRAHICDLEQNPKRTKFGHTRPGNEMYTLSGWGAAAPQTPGGLRPPCLKYAGKWGSNIIIIIVCQRYDLPIRVRYFDFLPHMRRVSLPHIRQETPSFHKQKPAGRSVGRTGGRSGGRSGGQAVGRSGGQSVGRSGGRSGGRSAGQICMQRCM